MARVNQPSDAIPLGFLHDKARVLRRHMMNMASRLGSGYIGQGLGIADVMAAIYFHELRYDPADPKWPGRDRFVLSTGHYSIALWAALAEAGIIPVEELVTYGADESRLDMSTLDTTPGVEMIGGSLGHGLGQAVGMALGQRLDGGDARVFCELSDGELQEGSTWEAAMSAAQFKLDNLVALVDCNGIQADGADRHEYRAGRRQMARLRLGDERDRRQRHGRDRPCPDWRAQPQRPPEGDRAAHLAGTRRADDREARAGAFRPRRCRTNGTS